MPEVLTGNDGYTGGLQNPGGKVAGILVFAQMVRNIREEVKGALGADAGR